MPVGLAIGGLGAIGSIGSALIGSNAAQNAAQIQAQQAAATAQMQMQLGQQGATGIGNAMNYLKPFIGGLSDGANPLSMGYNIGQGALQSLASLYGISTPGNPNPNSAASQAQWSNIMQTPAYQFAQQQGTLALDRSAAANGLLLSGGQLKDLSTFNQGLATQQIGNFTNTLSGLGGLYGQSINQQQSALDLYLRGAQGQASALTNTAQMVGGTQLGGANAQAAGVVGSANALTGGINNASNNLLSGYAISRFPGTGGYNPFNNASSYNPSSYNTGTFGGTVPYNTPGMPGSGP